MDRAERDRIEALARRTALEVLHSATLGTGELSQMAVARAISEAVAAVMADHDIERAHYYLAGMPMPGWRTCPIHGYSYGPSGHCPLADASGACARV